MTCKAASFFKQTIALLAAGILAGKASAQESRYTGTWVINHEIKAPDEHTSGVLTIRSSSSYWNIFNNQLLLDFDNKMKEDTLLLLYKSCDCSKPYKNSTIKFPKQNSVFAKCYRVSETELGVTYNSKAFIGSLKKYIAGTRQEKDVFPSILYLNNEKPSKNAHPVKTQ